MSKHTPGPWNWTSELNEKGNLTGKHVVYDNDEKLGFQYRDIAHVFKSKAEGKANARLIAAAPELLAQLKYIRQVLKTWLPDKSCELVNECDNIIAKAEGSK